LSTMVRVSRRAAAGVSLLVTDADLAGFMP
jgi:hypothetical protein